MTGVSESPAFLEMLNSGNIGELEEKIKHKETRIAFELWLANQTPAVLKVRGWKVLTALAKYASPEEDPKLAKIAATLRRTLLGHLNTECVQISEQAFIKGLISTSWALMKRADDPTLFVKAALEKWKKEPTEQTVRWLERMIQEPRLRQELESQLTASLAPLKMPEQKNLFAQAEEAGCTDLATLLKIEVVEKKLTFREKTVRFFELLAVATLFPVTVPLYCLSDKAKALIKNLYTEFKSNARSVEILTPSKSKAISVMPSVHSVETAEAPPTKSFEANFSLAAIKTTVGLNPLFSAIKAGDPEKVVAELQKGSDINQQSITGTTALMFAALDGNKKLVELLLDKGAKVNFTTFNGETALMAAALTGNMEIVELLLEHRADANLKSSDGHSVVNSLKMLRPKGWKKMLQMIESYSTARIFSGLKQQAKLYVTTKELSHACAVRGSGLVQGEEMPLEGAFSDHFASTMAKSIQKFSKEFPQLLDDATAMVLAKTLQYTADTHTNPPEQTELRIKQGMPTCILTGYKGHAATVLIWGDTLVWCDRSGAYTSACSIFRFNPSRIGAAAIKGLEDFRSKSGTDYSKGFLKFLIDEFGITQDENEKELEAFVDISNQVVGNCAWASVEGAIKAYVMLAKLKNRSFELQNLPLDKKEELKTYLNTAFTTWLLFQQMELLEKYLTRSPTVDRRLIFESFNALRSSKSRDPKLLQRIMALEDKYYERATPTDRQDYIMNKAMRSLFPYPNAWRNIERVTDFLSSLVR